ncbi:xylose isomerase [Anaerovibrio sp.]|uniref:xylose isomerase n=1 Tax=Anaerovibrio sp. TaxID=1872532 RepID=UPI003F1650AB
MLELVNLSNDITDTEGLLGGSPARLAAFLEKFHLDGIEFMCCAPWDTSFHTPDIIKGFHLWFWPSWLDFWLGNEEALLQEFGSRENIENCFGVSREAWLAKWAANFQQAADCGAEYAVFHVAQARNSEIRCRSFAYNSAQIIEAVLDIINQLSTRLPSETALLYENLWWPGLDFTSPALVHELLSGTQHKCGLMLDTGHLMNTNTRLCCEAHAADYILQMVDGLGADADHIRGIHLHASLSGDYVEREKQRHSHPEHHLTAEEIMAYVLRIDQHQPFKTAAARRIVDAIKPEYLVHEFVPADYEDWERKLAQQQRSLYHAAHV